MSYIKRSAVFFIITVVIFTLTFQSSAQQIDPEEWSAVEKVYLVTDNDTESNSGLTNAQIKAIYDYPSHRMRILFMIKFGAFEQEENIGIRFSLNGGEEISLHLNGDTEYNEDKYFLDFTHFTVPPSGVVYVEVTLGVKEGIPDEQTLKVIFIDPDSQLSNTYTVVMTDGETSVTSEEQTAKSEKTTKTKTKKNTSSGSGSKAQTDKNLKDEAESATFSQEEISKVTIRKAVESEDNSTFSGEKVLCISAAALIAVAMLFAGGMYFLKRKNHRGDED